MKKIFYFVAMFAMLNLATTSCSKDDDDNKDKNNTENTDNGGNNNGGNTNNGGNENGGNTNNGGNENGGNGNENGGNTNNGGNENGGNTNSLPANPIVVKQSGDFTISMNGENGVAVPGEEVSISFDRFPTNLADFQRTYDELKLTMGGVIVGNLMAYHLYYYDNAVGTAAIKLCNYENNVNSVTSRLHEKFNKNRISDSYCEPYLVASYLEGASPLNAYHPTKPYTVKLRMHPSDARAPQTGGFSFTGVDYTIQIWCNGVKNEDGTYGTWRNVEVLAKKGLKDFTMFNCPSLYVGVAQLSFLADPEKFEELK